MRPSERAPGDLRPITLETGVNRYAEGSCLAAFGHTRVLVTASLEEGVPPFLRGRGQGWVTAEYGMLPRATHTRGRREAAQGKQSGRTQEIQRLVGRSLRAVIDMTALGERQITLDCDVIQADGGTRTAAITGAWVALKLATKHLMEEGVIAREPILDHVAAVSCGLFEGMSPYRPSTTRRTATPKPTPTSSSPGPERSSKSRPPAKSAVSPAPSSKPCSTWPAAASRP